jgi:hypothetical protein
MGERKYKYERLQEMMEIMHHDSLMEVKRWNQHILKKMKCPLYIFHYVLTEDWSMTV